MPFRTRGGHRASGGEPPRHFGGWKAILVGILVIAAAILYAKVSR